VRDHTLEVAEVRASSQADTGRDQHPADYSRVQNHRGREPHSQQLEESIGADRWDMPNAMQTAGSGVEASMAPVDRWMDADLKWSLTCPWRDLALTATP